MNIKRVRLIDIAKKLGTSKNTVSRALRNCDDISNEMKEKVQKLALEMGYVPNDYAVSLSLGFTKNVVIAVNSLLNPFYAQLVEKISIKLREMGYSYFIHFIGDFILDDVNDILRTHPIGLISLSQLTEKAFLETRKQNLPILQFGNKSPYSEVSCSYTDDYQGGYLVAEYFYNKGLKRPLYASDSPDETSKRREKGFVDYFKSKNIEVTSFLNNHEDLVHKLEETFYKQIFDCCFMYSDNLAIEMKKIFLHSSLLLPDIFGFDDIEKNSSTVLPVNSVSSDYDQIIDESLEFFINRIEKGPGYGVYVKKYPVKLVLREK